MCVFPFKPVHLSALARPVGRSSVPISFRSRIAHRLENGPLTPRLPGGEHAAIGSEAGPRAPRPRLGAAVRRGAPAAEGGGIHAGSATFLDTIFAGYDGIYARLAASRSRRYQ